MTISANRFASACAAVVWAWMAALPGASAAVRTEIPLSSVVAQARYAVAVKVYSVNRERGIIIYSHCSDLKGKTKFTTFRHNLSTGEHRDADELLKRVNAGDAGVLFFTDEALAGITCFAHVGGIWYQTFARNESDPSKVWWNFTHQERYMNLSFVGESAALAESVRGLLSGREVEITRAAGPRDSTLIQVKICLKDQGRPPLPAPRKPQDGEPPK